MRHNVRLRQHRRTGLHQNILFGVLGRFFRHVHIFDAGGRGLKVLPGDGKLIRGVAQPDLVSTDGRAIFGQLRDGRIDTGQSRLRTRHRPMR